MSGALSAMCGGSGGRLLTIGNLSTAYGFSSGGGYGSMSPTEFLSSTITRLNWGPNELALQIANTSQPNSGWSSINVNGTVFLRTNAAYSSGTWLWTSVTTNPIGTTGTIPVNIA